MEANLDAELSGNVDDETREFFKEFFAEEPVYFITATTDGEGLILDETVVRFGF